MRYFEILFIADFSIFFIFQVNRLKTSTTEPLKDKFQKKIMETTLLKIELEKGRNRLTSSFRLRQNHLPH